MGLPFLIRTVSKVDTGSLPTAMKVTVGDFLLTRRRTFSPRQY